MTTHNERGFDGLPTAQAKRRYTRRGKSTGIARLGNLIKLVVPPFSEMVSLKVWNVLDFVGQG